jgi:hypothetical protein
MRVAAALRWPAVRAFLAAALCLLGCGESDEPTPAEGCAPTDIVFPDGTCVAPGLPADLPCPPGEAATAAGCVPAGVPPDGCGEGFVHDGLGGCDAILPATPCPLGTMALPGETACREVAPCGAAPFGDIPVEASTEHVDGSFAGASDGSPASPWRTIQEGVDAAVAGAVVAIAAGDYAEDVVVSKPVRLWGRCPSLVTIRGATANRALGLRDGYDGSEVHRIGFRTAHDAIIVFDPGAVLLDELWVHETGGIGVGLQGAAVTLRGSLIERVTEAGVLVSGGDAQIEATVIRDIAPNQGYASGVSVSQNDGVIGHLHMLGSIVERSADVGVYISGSEATLEGSLVRDTSSLGTASSGIGIQAGLRLDSGVPATLTVTRSIIERSSSSGILLFGSAAQIDATVIRDVLSIDVLSGRGVSAIAEEGVAATLTLERSLVARTHGAGVLTHGSTTTLRGVAVRDIAPDAVNHARGVSAGLGTRGERSQLTIESSLVERTAEFGLFVQGADATVETTVVRDIQQAVTGFTGRGIHVQDENGSPGGALVRACLVERVFEAGILVSGAASATIESSLVRDTRAGASGFFGDGVIAASVIGHATVTLSATRIEASARAAVSGFGADVAIGTSLLSCQAFDLGAEPFDGVPASFDDRGGVFCGCPEATNACSLSSYALQPPPSLD